MGMTNKEFIDKLTENIPTWKLILIDKWTDLKVLFWLKTHKEQKMGILIDTPFIAHSELTDEIYIIDKKAKYCVTDQVIKAVVATNRAILKADYENRLKADMVAMLTEIQLELDEMKITKVRSAGFAPYSKDPFRRGVNCSKEVIQQKIDKLKEVD